MKKNNNKGFTLVELIVVLVILAILAAILVPALLGYIDKAKQGQYAEEAHSILTAAQAYETEQYAKTNGTFVTNFASDAKALKYVNDIVDPTNVTALTVVKKGDTTHEAFTVGSITALTFTSQDGNTVEMTFADGTWSDPKVTKKSN